MSGRTPSSILRGKRAAQEGAGGAGGKRRFKSMSGRRVSFAPDDELETMHLFTDKNTPSPLPQQQQQQDTQPLGELQNLVHSMGTPSQAAQQNARQPQFESPALGKRAAAAAAASPGGPFSPTISMELTNDTLQQDAAAASAAARTTPRRAAAAAAAAAAATAAGAAGPGADDDMSLTLDAGHLGGGAGALDGTATFNITENVPGLSTLVEEDEEEDAYATGAAGGGEPPGGGAGAGGDVTAEMDLTGLTGGSGFGAGGAHTPKGAATPRAGLPSPSPGRYNTRRSSRADTADAEPAQAPPAPAAAATPVAVAAVATTPKSGRRSSARGAAAGSVSPMIMLSPPSAAKTTPSRARGSAAKAAKSPAAKSPAAKSPAPAAAAAAAPAPSPSPLRRSTRLSAGLALSPLPPALQPVAEDPEAEQEPGPLPEDEQQEAQPAADDDHGAAGQEVASDGEEEEEAGAAQDAAEEEEEQPAATERVSSPLALSPGPTEVVGAAAGAGGRRASSGRRLSLRSSGRRTRGSSLGGAVPAVDTAVLRDKWGFVPGDDNTMALDLDRHGLGGLGEATLHGVYADDTSTDEVSNELRQAGRSAAATDAAGAALAGDEDEAAAAAEGDEDAGADEEAPAVGAEEEPATFGSDVEMADAEPERGDEEAAAEEEPAPAARAPAPVPVRPAGAMTRGRRSSVAQLPHLPAIAESGAASPAALATPAGAALTPGSAVRRHAAADARARGGDAGASPAGGDADGAFDPETEGLTTKLMQIMDDQEEEGLGGAEEGAAAGAAAPAEGWGGVPLARVSMGGGRGSVGSNMVVTANLQRHGSAGAQAGATTRLLADTHDALLAEPPAAPLGAGNPPAGAATLYDDGFTSHLLADATGASSFIPRHAANAAAAARAMRSPAPRSPALVAAAAAAAGALGSASDPSLELAVAMAAAAGGGHEDALMEDNTIDHFALPPELVAAGAHAHAAAAAAAAAAQQAEAAQPALWQGQAVTGDDRGATMPFSGAMGSALGGMTPRGSHRAAQIITFQDFLQVVDMQFLDHIRRGTSINMMDLAPGPMPNDLAEGLKALTLTSPEVAVLDAALTELHGVMRSKRAQVHGLEEELEGNNPDVFTAVQTARRTELEGMKHALVVRKKCCRAQTGSAWKQLRAGMERALAARLADQQAQLDEELAFVQTKLQRAQQQRELVQAFAVDVQRSIDEDAARREGDAVARSRLRYARARLEELRAINADRQRRADEVAAEAAKLQFERTRIEGERSAAQQQLDKLSSTVSSVPTPVRGQPSADRLIDAGERLDILSGLQPWRLKATDGGGWLLRFRLGLACRLSFSGERGCRAAIEVTVEPPAAGVPALQSRMLQQLAATMPERHELPAAALRYHMPLLALRLDRMAALAEHAGRAFVACRPLAGARVDAAAGRLVLSFVDAARGAKVEVGLGLAALLDPRLNTAVESTVEVVAAPEGWALAAQEAQAALAPALAAAAGSPAGAARVLDAVCDHVAALMRGACSPGQGPAAGQAAPQAGMVM